MPRADPGRAHPYVCPAGYWTIGYGHLCDSKHPPITEAEAEGYGVDSPVDQVDAEIDVMQDVERLLDRIRSIRSERIETMQADLDGLAATATSLSSRVAPDLSDQSPEDVALELARRLDLAQKAEAAATDLLARLHRSQAELTEAQKRLQAVHARLALLMAAAGVEEVTALGRAIERSDERRAVERKIQSAEQDLAQAADGLSLEDLRRESEVCARGTPP